MVEELETIVTFLQNNKPAALFVTGALATGAAYLVVQFDKHVAPYISGMVLYPLVKKDISLIEFLRQEHRLNLNTRYPKKADKGSISQEIYK